MIYATKQPFPVIIQKDLSIDGFFAPRTPPVHIEDTKKMIQTLARIHAASLHLVDIKELDLSNYNFTIFDSNAIVTEMFETTWKALKAVMATWDGFGGYIPKLDNLFKNAQKLCVKACTANKPGDGFNILNHADFHPRNSLVKMTEDNRVESFRLVSSHYSFCLNNFV